MFNEFGWWGMGLGPMFMLLFFGVLIFGLATLIRWLSAESSTRRAREKTAVEIVQERYARGEMDREEYEQKMQDLGPRP